jgi:hypothetical protein
MRKFVISAAAMTALATLFASAPATADHIMGGPIQKGDQCFTTSPSSKDFGYWSACPKPASAPVVHAVRRHRHQS